MTFTLAAVPPQPATRNWPGFSFTAPPLLDMAREASREGRRPVAQVNVVAASVEREQLAADPAERSFDVTGNHGGTTLLAEPSRHGQQSPSL